MTTTRAIKSSILMLPIIAAMSLASSRAHALSYNVWDVEIQRIRSTHIGIQKQGKLRRRHPQEKSEKWRRAQEIFNRSMDEALRREEGH
jgi:hypothetical protein